MWVFNLWVGPRALVFNLHYELTSGMLVTNQDRNTVTVWICICEIILAFVFKTQMGPTL